MMRRILVALAAEWIKYARMPLPYLGLLTIMCLSAATLFVYPVAKDGVSDFGFIGHAVPAALNLAGLLFSLGYSASLISSEVAAGTIRTVLVRPIARHEFYLAKLINGLAFATLLALVALATALISAAFFGELSGIAFGDELMYTTTEIYAAMALATALNLMPHFAAVAYALFVSALTSRPAAAIGIAVGLWLLVDYVKHPLGISAFVFTTYVDHAWIVFQDRCSGLDTPFFPESATASAICLIWFLIFAIASIFVIGRRSFGP